MLPTTAHANTRSRAIMRIWPPKSAKGFVRNLRAGSAAGTREIPKLVTSPHRVYASRMTPDHVCRPRNATARNPAAIVAVIAAINVPSSITPFPQESSFSGSSSGRRPYFAGPNSAPCVLIRKTVAASIGRFPTASERSAKIITPISKIFVPMVTERLLKRSARYPPASENRR